MSMHFHKGTTIGFLIIMAFLTGTLAGQEQRLRLIRTIPLPGVKGRIDHMALDPERQRLFVAALGNNSLEVVDFGTGRRITSISGLREPQGVFYDTRGSHIYVSNGGDGTVRIYDAATFRPAGVVSFSADADNLHFEERTKYLYVGYGDGALGIVDTRTQKLVGDVKLAGHPEGFALERIGGRIFINVPKKRGVSVMDGAQQKAVADWPVTCAENFPMALDEAHRRLFIGCRGPAKVLVYDTETGRQTAEMPIARDIDDLFYDPFDKYLFASCGAGSVLVFVQKDPDHYGLLAEVKTSPGARTSLFDGKTRRLFVAAPRSGGRPAEILVYQVGP